MEKGSTRCPKRKKSVENYLVRLFGADYKRNESWGVITSISWIKTEADDIESVEETTGW